VLARASCRSGDRAQLSDGIGEIPRLRFTHPLLGLSPLVGDREETFIDDRC
jgi:hypothetical protein